MKQLLLIVIVVAFGAGCAPEVMMGANLAHANLRVPYQTDPNAVVVLDHDVDRPYDVLGDIEVMLRQRGAYGDLPTKELAIRELRKHGARVGAHAVIMVSFGQMGMSFWSYKELQGHGRAIRFR